jgi:hypothetical protein
LLSGGVLPPNGNILTINSKYNARETSSFTVGMEVYGREEDSTTVIIL